MKNTSIDHNDNFENKATGYKYINGKNSHIEDMCEEADYVDKSVAYSAGGLQSTIEDLFIWDQALYTEKLIKQENLNKAFVSNQGGYGYGFWVDKSDSRHIVRHTGWAFGFETGIYRDIGNKNTVIILCNNAYDNPFYSNRVFSFIDAVL